MIPGEHLGLPTLEGVRRIAAQVSQDFSVRKTPVYYSLGYVLRALWGTRLPVSLDWIIPVPVGAFALTLSKAAS